MDFSVEQVGNLISDGFIGMEDEYFQDVNQ